jgi:hypothetical protein
MRFGLYEYVRETAEVLQKKSGCSGRESLHEIALRAAQLSKGASAILGLPITGSPDHGDLPISPSPSPLCHPRSSQAGPGHARFLRGWAEIGVGLSQSIPRVPSRGPARCSRDGVEG